MDIYLFFLINYNLQNNVFDIAMPFITNKGYILFIAVLIPLFFKGWRKGILVSIFCILVAAQLSYYFFKKKLFSLVFIEIL